MKKPLLMPLLISLIENSRRNRTRCNFLRISLLLFILLLGVFSVLPLGSESFHVNGKIRYSFSASVRGYDLYVSSSFKPQSVKKLIENLKRGLRAEICFQFRLYRRVDGIFAFIGDKLAEEREVKYVASYDVFENSFSVYSGNKLIKQTHNVSDFLSSFLNLNNFYFGSVGSYDRSKIILRGRINFVPVKLKPPLNIVLFFTTLGNVTTKWVEISMGD